MIQIEIIESYSEASLVKECNYFLEQLEEHLFVDIRFSSFLVDDEDGFKTKYCVLIIYRVL